MCTGLRLKPCSITVPLNSSSPNDMVPRSRIWRTGWRKTICNGAGQEGLFEIWPALVIATPIATCVFKVGDIMETDHITPRSKGGKDEYQNFQLLHRHCHDTKTAQERAVSEVCMTDIITLRSRVMWKHQARFWRPAGSVTTSPSLIKIKMWLSVNIVLNNTFVI